MILSSFERHFGTRNTAETEAVVTRSDTRPIPSLYVIGAVCAIVIAVIVVGLFVGNPAIATDPAKFPETKMSDWAMEEDVQKTRWLLEQPVDSNHESK